MLRESSTIASVSATAYAGPCSLSLGRTYQFAYFVYLRRAGAIYEALVRR